MEVQRSTFEFTAKGRYYKTYVDSIYQTQHTTEREALEECCRLAVSNPDSKVLYRHEYEVEVDIVIGGFSSQVTPVKYQTTIELDTAAGPTGGGWGFSDSPDNVLNSLGFAEVQGDVWWISGTSDSGITAQALPGGDVIISVGLSVPVGAHFLTVEKQGSSYEKGDYTFTVA